MHHGHILNRTVKRGNMVSWTFGFHALTSDGVFGYAGSEIGNITMETFPILMMICQGLRPLPPAPPQGKGLAGGGCVVLIALPCWVYWFLDLLSFVGLF